MNIKRKGIRLSGQEAMYLRNTAFLPESLAQIIKSFAVAEDKGAEIFIAHEVLEQFRSAFTERLAKVGFDEKYNLTTEGKLLEDLIDRFYV